MLNTHSVRTSLIYLTLSLLALFPSVLLAQTNAALEAALLSAGYPVTGSVSEALSAYQTANAAAILGGEGVLNNLGELDPLTRAHLFPQAVLGTTFSPFTLNLFYQMEHPDVKRLQQYLNQAGYPIASSGPGSKGQETTYYGPATLAAVKRLQEDNAATILIPNQLTSGTGLFFPSTRAVVNSRLSLTTTPTTSTVLPPTTSTPTTPLITPSQTTRTLTVKGSSRGTVTTDSGLTCSSASCAFVIAKDSTVTLTARANSGSRFTRWSGSCSSSRSTCSVTMNTNKTATATFRSTSSGGGGGGGGSSSGGGSSTPSPTPTPTTYTLSTAVSGSGSITGTGISCGSDCSDTYTEGQSVTLTATPASGYTFAGWSGSCSGTQTTCVVTLSSARSVQASFSVTPTAPAPTYTLTVSRTGSGTLTGTGINCGSDCTESYPSGTNVTLTATPASGYTFAGWGGACSGTQSTCVVAMSTQARSVSSTFTVTPTTVNGQCGSSANQSFSSAPSSNLCSAGTASLVTTNTGTYTWSCAGSGGGTTAQCAATRTTPPVGGGGTTYYFSDCQSGAHGSCVPGNNANAGTSSSAPKRDLSGMNLNALPGGTTLLFARGGAWTINRLQLQNLNTSAASPLTFDAYGSGVAPLWRTTNAGVGVQIGGNWGNTDLDRGYVFRNIRLQSVLSGDTNWGFWFVQNTADITLENVEITGYNIGIHSGGGTPHGVQNFTLRNSVVSQNSDMGFLGTIEGSLFEGNLFEGNNFSGSGFSHAIYLSRGNDHVLRNNRFVRNSNLNGVCTGGNVTIHGTFNGFLAEGNTIEHDSAGFGCYGFSITAGYTDFEQFNNVVLRDNTVINTGLCSFCVNSAPGILIEDNIVRTSGNLFHYGIWAEANGEADTPSSGATIRNNTMCVAGGSEETTVVQWSAANPVLMNNVVRRGAESTTGACAL